MSRSDLCGCQQSPWTALRMEGESISSMEGTILRCPWARGTRTGLWPSSGQRGAGGGVVGVAVIGGALGDTFEPVVLQRRVTRLLRPARLFFKGLWKLWLLVAAVIRRPGRRESFLRLFGPFSLIVLLGGWSMMLLLGFALVHSALGLQIAVPERPPTFFTALYLSGTTL